MAETWVATLKDMVTPGARSATASMKTLSGAATQADRAMTLLGQKKTVPMAPIAGSPGSAGKGRLTFGDKSPMSEPAGSRSKTIFAKPLKYEDTAGQIRKANLSEQNRRSEVSMGRDGNMAMAAASVAAVGYAAFSAAQQVTALTVAFGRAVLEAQEFKNNAMIALTALLKSPQAAKAAYEQAAALSVKLGQDFRQGVGGFNTFIARGFDVKGAEDAMRAVADLKVMTPTIDSQRIITALSQIKSKGKLQMEELQQQLGEAFDVGAVIDELALKMKKTPEQVRDAIKKGQVNAEMGLDAFFNAVRKKTGMGLGDLAEKKADSTFTGMAMRAANMKDQMLAAVNIDWTPMKSALGNVMALMQSDRGKQFLDKIGDSMSRVVQATFGIFEGEEGFKKLEAVLSGVEGAASATARAFEAVGSVVDVFAKASAAVDEFLGVAGGMSAIIEGTFSGLGRVILAGATLGMSELYYWFEAYFGLIGDAAVGWGMRIGKALIRGIFAVATLGASEVAIALKDGLMGGGDKDRLGEFDKKVAQLEEQQKQQPERDATPVGSRAAQNMGAGPTNKTQNNNAQLTVINNNTQSNDPNSIMNDMMRNLSQQDG